MRAKRKIVIDDFTVKQFFKRVNKTNICWEWKVNINSDGYGIFSQHCKQVLAYRWSYVYHKGLLADELEIDHLCRNRKCVNPEHLEAVTKKENLNRGISHARLKSHCPSGHPYDDINTYIIKNSRGQHRMCRTCRYERNKVASINRRLQYAK